ncbi:MAG: chorismate synthase [Candidatus Cloacimonetes bacterium]|nr:chorismate synthase [Candidatus Cloacimonadota bacterium]MDY0229110.1 chorismate synthase [Candidatus Cloacimonadaceae bacterium]
MRSNRLSELFGITTFGESHGPAIGLLIDSPPPNLDFPSAELCAALQQRSHKGDFSTSRHETDRLEILSGVFEGKTTGMPLCVIVRNCDAKSADYEALKDVFRPGHADYSWFQKYQIFDYRGGGRASGRESLARVIAADLAKNLLKDIKIEITSTQIGELKAGSSSAAGDNPFHWPEPDTYPELIKYLDEIKSLGDSLGGILHVSASNIPSGLGDPIYEKLSANIAKAMFSIGTVRGILFGDGLDLARRPGSQCNDQFAEGRLASNHHGGIVGGVSNGQDLVFELVIRPISSISIPQEALDKAGKPRRISIQGRHDVCHLPRLIPVVEAMLQICLADAIQYQRLISGQSADLPSFRESLDKIDEELITLLWRRRAIVQKVKQYKQQNDLSPQDPAREREILRKAAKLAEGIDLPPELVQDLIKINLRISDTC